MAHLEDRTLQRQAAPHHVALHVSSNVRHEEKTHTPVRDPYDKAIVVNVVRRARVTGRPRAKKIKGNAVSQVDRLSTNRVRDDEPFS